MRVILLGAPGSGKGTQGMRLSERTGVRHVSSGELLRAHMGHDTALGASIEGFVRRGELVPDDVILEVLRDVIGTATDDGYILDGFPRTRSQAEAAFDLASPVGMTADVVVHLAVPDDAVRQRLATRSDGRADDGDPDVIERRLGVYHDQTGPLLDFYRERGILTDIDATAAPDEVTTAIAEALGDVMGGGSRAVPDGSAAPG